ncbi:hypothetical protein [Solwaraspora sp. WMMA2065]|uniref:NACHT domain-containing protein n=1 Tax=Solwaraspora sp. WMMA2065 TaxID=3015166 RepID=UPI00259AFBE1|nr:hypothetical protein [Solwaraspora sp. WMMA2065]WJK34745.1 hypothetical protein O7610_29950 [Solwaraspora sp. WMMA2065]
MHIQDSGKEFEKRALAVARAIYDPSGTQGPVIYQGREHDGAFVNDRSIAVFEFTTSRTKQKAIKDATKISDLLRHLQGIPDNRFKMAQGYFVTADEPDAEQRKAVEAVAKSSNMHIVCMSLLTLRRQLIDSENYIALRRKAPFGSTGFKLTTTNPKTRNAQYIEPILEDITSGGTLSLEEVVEAASNGDRFVLIADFGSGKSEALRQAFERLRKRHFKDAATQRIPLHINLNDCFGLRSPAEVIRRHSEDIGFPGQDSLVAAWRSDACILLLDGFDELVPYRWVGGARDLRQVRRSALEPVRRLIADSSPECGVIIAGRPQYFASNSELLETLALTGGRVLTIHDFNTEQVQQFTGLDATLPSWIPPRPLLLKFLLQNEFFEDLPNLAYSGAEAWLDIIDVVARREADRISTVTPDNVRKLIARISSLARGGRGQLGPVAIKDMRSAFHEVCGYEAEEEGIQLLLRLPGLGATNPKQGDEEERYFIDSDLADAAYGIDLASYISAPYSRHPLSSSVSWNTSTGTISADVCAAELTRIGFDSNITSGAIKKRLDDQFFDSILFDTVAVSSHLGTKPSNGLFPFFDEILVPRITLSGDDGYLSHATFKDCVIETLDVTEFDNSNTFPTFHSCLIGKIDGWSQLPASYQDRFVECDIEEFSSTSQTTSGLLQLPIAENDKVALVVLKKVYAQAGSGRKFHALARGLPLSERSRVPDVVQELVSMGYLSRATAKGNDIILPLKARRKDVVAVLSNPGSFSLSALKQ